VHDEGLYCLSGKIMKSGALKLVKEVNIFHIAFMEIIFYDRKLNYGKNWICLIFIINDILYKLITRYKLLISIICYYYYKHAWCMTYMSQCDDLV
jgi:hypothetical protein